MGMNNEGWTSEDTSGMSPPIPRPIPVASDTPRNENGNTSGSGGIDFGSDGPTGDISLGGAIFMLTFFGILGCLFFNAGSCRTWMANQLATVLPKSDHRSHQQRVMDDLKENEDALSRKIMAFKPDPLVSHDDTLRRLLLPENAYKDPTSDPLLSYQRWSWKERLAYAGVSQAYCLPSNKLGCKIQDDVEVHFLSYLAFSIATAKDGQIAMPPEHFKRWQEIRDLVYRALHERSVNPHQFSAQDLEKCRLERFQPFGLYQRPERNNEWHSEVISDRELEEHRNAFRAHTAPILKARKEHEDWLHGKR